MHSRDLRPPRARELPRSRISTDALSLAVIIPTLDEADGLAELLDDLCAQRDISFEVIIADGGSSDSTVDVATARGARIVRAPCGRGAQMNAGRAATTADLLLFLHADTRLESPSTLRDAARAIEERAGTCGHFRLRFRGDDPRYRFLEAKTALNRPHTTNGDQGLMFRAADFDALGGFDEDLPFLEDQRIAARAREAGHTWITLPGEITTSARRFEAEGFSERYFAMAVTMCVWASGANEFFELTPRFYPPHPSSKLDLRPMLDALRETMRQMGGRRSVRAWLDATAFARRHAWQLFYALDVALADDDPAVDHPCLDLYDRLDLDRARSLADPVIAATACVVVLGILPPLLERWSRA